MNYSSEVIEEAVIQLSRFPGIGKKTALRMVLHLIREEDGAVNKLTDAITSIKTQLKFCSTCGNVSQKELCSICSSHNRKKEIICIVKDFQDIFAIEQTGQYNGVYHVLGGLISPLEGIGPTDIKLESLFARIDYQEIDEIILGLSATMEGDTTSFYIFRKLQDKNIKISMMSRGISVGGELEYADVITLARSMRNRIPFNIKDSS